MYNNLFFLEMMKKFQPYNFYNADYSKSTSAYQEYIMTMQKMMMNYYQEFNSFLQNSRCFTAASNSSECPFSAYSKELYQNIVDHGKTTSENLTADANEILSDKLKIMNDSFNELNKIFKDKDIQDYLKLDDKDLKSSLLNVFDQFKLLSEKIHTKSYSYADDYTKKFHASVKEFYEVMDKLKKQN